MTTESTAARVYRSVHTKNLLRALIEHGPRLTFTNVYPLPSATVMRKLFENGFITSEAEARETARGIQFVHRLAVTEKGRAWYEEVYGAKRV